MTPNSPADERGLIAALTFEPAEVVPACIEAGVTGQTFTDTDARTIYETVMGAHAEGITPSIEVTFQRSGLAVQVFARFAADPPASLGWRGHIAALRTLETRRSLILHANALAEAAKSDPDSIPDRLARVLMAQTGQTKAKPWRAVLSEVLALSESIARGEVQSEHGDIPWPWSDCDRVFQKFKRKELVIIAARPSVGKSSLMRSLVLHAAQSGFNSLVLSIEDSAENIALGLAATVSGVSKTDFNHAHKSDQQDFIRALRGLELPNLHVFDRDRSIAGLTARAKVMHAQAPLDLICIDYLGQIVECREGTGSTNKASAIGNVTKALKDLAADLNCVVIFLAQFNRESARDNREPRLYDLKDSGDIEQDCDRAIFIHRPESDPMTQQTQSEADSVADRPRYFQNLIQAKGRNVGTGIVSMYFERAITRFTQISR